ncbi:AMP-dependent synthetase and ligase OS=Tsukamurella paurometabola (strain ATCC 8368 / DSM /CCUG 35730 / CIP 100753 / JCM 10117 / KCTC 9821 / NBRC 16120/ NCIMB 702349 / NCTC 13040) OX=521096 GN=Tpau_1163 PE=3 SV=1 [Tsukamurella paurometabola]|uniref:AMP-dependent synthetase and ligase n=1 Tax=Tsukamurella paurometabola (strain ATCC 8368 / DSM 20162 / CCUG 35730 / CIP 100753 / JCM 10117 / KCTC 9821 / NBRC 16120 / NCIMB 702349 / NCTC 13040) TaxID=521096 RepID=D5UVY7_TSUPD|nr:long-chain-acyl-CoA synthetase [Tsukamurella paurometabola]ADG77794.1 AMP-dependent synthetase and ligase [Tsukamurella paurometabola DSM 20162]SUP28780.1 Long-chain-fatty-acid--CoA ligase FadD17 [Tsukamurella paurometabola]
MNSAHKNTTVGLTDLAKGLRLLVPDLPLLVKEGPSILLRSQNSKQTIGSVFQKRAAQNPSRDFLRFRGEGISYGEANATVNTYARVLQQRGVKVGDVVGVVMHNHPQMVLVMLAIVKVGATAGLVNYNQRGAVLAHSLGILDTGTIVTDEEDLEAFDSLDDADKPADGVLLTVEDLAKQARAVRTQDPSAIENPAVTSTLPASTRAFYVFTSGTTGLPKASIMTHYRWLKGMSGFGATAVRMRGNDVMYCPLPLYHNNAALVALGSVLVSGATLAIGRKFSASKFWDEANENSATMFIYIGEICRYLLNQPAKPSDRSNTIRVAAGNGMRPEIWSEFQERFGIERIMEFYAASETNIAFVNVFNIEGTVGLCPLPHAVVEYDIDTAGPLRDGAGRLTRVKKGQNGLLLTKITKAAPFDGYTDGKANDAKLIRDGFKDGDVWFNTGDVVTNQGFDHIAFVDRLGDTFRWKGENVATTEVEGALDEADQVEGAIVYGVAIPGADGKAGMAAVKLAQDWDFDGAVLATELRDRLPGYAIPLYVRLVPSLEVTSTFKSLKGDLRKEGFESTGDDPLYVFVGGADGYVPAYEGFAADVAAAKVPDLRN